MQSSQYYKDLLVQDKLLNQAVNTMHIKEIFKAIDHDESGTITMSEIMQCLSKGNLKLQSYFEALDISATDTLTLFTLLDRDGSGEVDIDEFCDGCSRLRGNAKAFDINTVLYENRKIAEQLTANLTSILSKMELQDTAPVETHLRGEHVSEALHCGESQNSSLGTLVAPADSCSDT